MLVDDLADALVGVGVEGRAPPDGRLQGVEVNVSGEFLDWDLLVGLGHLHRFIDLLPHLCVDFLPRDRQRERQVSE